MTDEPDMFATSDDLEQRWHKLTDEEREKADTHLMDVTDYIKERSPNWQGASSDGYPFSDLSAPGCPFQQ